MKIAIFTGNRAEYGLLLPIIKAVDNHPELEYQLIVSGAHLDDNFGATLNLIEKDGFHIDATPKIQLDSDDLDSTAKAIGYGIVAMVETLKELKPDILVVYADRFEGFAAIIAGSQTNVPIAHIEGGDLTEGGALDDSMRHAMTKLSHLHFTTNEDARKRVLTMGEEDWRVYNIGLPTIDLILDRNFATAEELSEKYSISLYKPIVLFTQHSVTTEFYKAKSQIQESISALIKLATEGYQVIITYPNNDAGGKRIIDEFEKVKSMNLENIQIHRTLGIRDYHGYLALAQHEEVNVVCVGNSSSGLKETPIFGCPVVNIGNRQLGRLRAENVIDVEYNSSKIYKKICFALTNKRFRKLCKNVKNPYGNGRSGEKVAKILAMTEINSKLIQKKMTILN